MSNSELGAFLRARREELSPEGVGLPASPRRRTPGLRRAELATLAGVSVEYLTRLEQGRDRNPSTEVISALARALRLELDAEVHLRKLSKTAAGSSCSAAPAPTRTVRSSITTLLERLDPTPAVVLNQVSDLLAHTRAFGLLAEATGLLDDPVPNFVRFVFTHTRARATFPDWDRDADEHLASLREQAACGDPHATELATELAGVPEFNRRWTGAPALPTPAGAQRWTHPELGELRMVYELLEFRGEALRLVTYLPADEQTTARLDRLAGRTPGALHVVNA